MASICSVAKGDYNLAKKYYKNNNYEAAAAHYFSSFKRSKSKTIKIKSEWGLAQSLSKLGLYYSSSKYYSVIVRRGRKKSNPFFRNALENLGKINSRISLGQSHIVQLFKARIRSSDVPGPARGFYFYYLGVEAFGSRKLERAKSFFVKVPAGSSYYLGSIFHLGVIANLSGNHSRAITHFQRVISGIGNKTKYREMKESAYMNIARVHYETKKYSQAINYYGQVPRHSENWLDAIWESSWAFFFMEKFNNTLGNIHTIHSPFFIDRFYPESYILQAITFLKLCRFDQVKESMKRFKDTYTPVFKDVKSMLGKLEGDPRGFFKIVYQYKTSNLNRYTYARQILKQLSFTDAYKGATDTIRFADRELALLEDYQRWRPSGLLRSINDFLKSKKKVAIKDAGRRLFRLGATYYSQLLELSNQTKLIVAEMQLGKLAKLRSKINVDKDYNKVQFIGGLQKLNIGQSLEYWPFQSEYWDDELGYYVYNLNSKCAKK